MATTTVGKINVFSKAKGKTATLETSKSRKETIWSISPQVTPEDATREQLNDAVTQMHILHAEAKAIEAKEKVYKSILKSYAEDRYVESLAATGVEPPSPLKIVNDKGQSTTFVVQDRGHLTKISDAQLELLTEIIGEDAVDKIVYEAGEFKFDALVMAQEAPKSTAEEPKTVQDVVAEAISATLEKLVASGNLTAVQVESLLSYSCERRFKPGLVGKAIEVCGRNVNRLASFFDAVAGAVVKYVKC